MDISDKEQPKVVVVGAGLAGLTAARRLVDAGCDVTVFEARDRVGGRTFSPYEGFVEGQHGDLGAELITPDYTSLIALCDEVGVELSTEIWIERPDTIPGETPIEGYLAVGRIVVDGQLLSGDRFTAIDREIRAALSDAPPAAHETVEQWTRRARLSADSRGAIAGIARMAVQCDPALTDAHHLTSAHILDIRRILGGSQQLALALARDVDVRLESPVRVIRQAGGRVQVEFENGGTQVANQAVVTVPAAVLPSIGFEPPLSPAHLGTLTSLQRAYGGKVVAQYAEGDQVREALTRAVFADGPINTAWVSNHYITHGPAVVSGFICGGERAALESELEALEALDKLVSVAVGRRVTRLAGLCKNWSTDPYALGMGASCGTTTRRATIAQLALPERRVHFAGDYTDVPMAGTMEGAVRSGERAADEVLRLPARLSLTEINTELVRA